MTASRTPDFTRTRATPKSPSFTSPTREMKTLEGETSQWTSCSGVTARALGPVGVVERLEQHPGEVDREVDRQRDPLLAAAAEHLAEVAPVHPLHRQVVHVADGAHVERLDDVRMAQGDGELGLAGEQLDVLRVPAPAAGAAA